MCYRAMNNCGFLLEYKLWPDFIDCSDTAERNRGRRIFSDGSCKVYLTLFSQIFIDDFCIYSFTLSLVSSAIYWFLWLLSYNKGVAERAMCFNKLRRDEALLR
ncbi:unnamed protein product [Gongylonema pulchrum]|uniref:XK-related protein n=1 Tax=Gongylonema pulchrum TaxID=637853 RepID=A0A183EDA6_9BILA|nr:unnamed protein product [Gongylonema pulchrum]